jgi:hypothetical protein
MAAGQAAQRLRYGIVADTSLESELSTLPAATVVTT